MPSVVRKCGFCHAGHAGHAPAVAKSKPFAAALAVLARAVQLLLCLVPFPQHHPVEAPFLSAQSMLVMLQDHGANPALQYLVPSSQQLVVGQAHHPPHMCLFYGSTVLLQYTESMRCLKNLLPRLPPRCDRLSPQLCSVCRYALTVAAVFSHLRRYWRPHHRRMIAPKNCNRFRTSGAMLAVDHLERQDYDSITALTILHTIG